MGILECGLCLPFDEVSDNIATSEILVHFEQDVGSEAVAFCLVFDSVGLVIHLVGDRAIFFAVGSQTT